MSGRHTHCKAGAAHSKGQSSLEALLSLAALLSALCLLAVSSGKITEKFSESISISESRLSLSQDALFLDSMAHSPSGITVSRNFSCVPSLGGKAISSKEMPTIREPLFHTVSYGSSGKLYVQKEEGEPV